jgi:hypothetical protein
MSEAAMQPLLQALFAAGLVYARSSFDAGKQLRTFQILQSSSSSNSAR